MGYNSTTPVLLIERFGVQPMSLAVLLIVVGAANVLVQAGLVGRLVALFGEQRLAIAGLLFQALGMLSMITVPAFWMLYPISAITSGGAGPLRPTLSALLANQVAVEEQGKLNGVSTALGSLMTVFGPLWAGATYDYVAPSAPFLAGAILLVLASTLLVRVRAASAAHISHSEAYR